MKGHRKNNEKTSNDRSRVLTFVSYAAKSTNFEWDIIIRSSATVQVIKSLGTKKKSSKPSWLLDIPFFVSLDNDLKMVTLVKR